MAQKRIVSGVIAIVCTVALWYGYSYGVRYYKQHAWAHVPTTPAAVSDSVKFVSLSCKGVSLLDDVAPLTFTADERTLAVGEVVGDPNRWSNSLYAPNIDQRQDAASAEPRLPNLYLRCRFWRSGGTKFDNEVNQAHLNLKRRDATAFTVRGQLHAPRRPGEYELQIWAVERDPADPNLQFSREWKTTDVIVGRRTVSIRPKETTK